MNIVNNGRRVLLMHQDSLLEKDIIFSMDLFTNYSNHNRNENSSVGFMMKWKPLENKSDFWDYQNLFENGNKFTLFQKNRNEANISFTNYFFNNACSECSSKQITFSLYSKNKLKNVNFVNNIYTLDQPAIKTIIYKDEALQNSESFNETFELNEEDCCEWFAAAQVYFINSTTNEEVWLSYNSTILTDPPKNIHTQQPRKYNYIDITKDDKYFTILLTKENYDDSLLYFELSYSSIDVNSLNIITEKYKENPTFEQDIDIECISTNISNNGKNSYLFKMPTSKYDYDMLLHFSNVNKTDMNIMFKYFTFKQEEDYKQFKSIETNITFNAKSIKTQHVGKRIKFTFTDMFNSSFRKILTKAEYSIIVYDGNTIPSLSYFKSIYANNSNAEIVKELKVQTDFRNKTNNFTFNLDKKLSKVYISVNARLIDKNGNEYLVHLHALETKYINDTVLILLVVVLSCLLCIIVIYFIWKIKKKSSVRSQDIENQLKSIPLNSN